MPTLPLLPLSLLLAAGAASPAEPPTPPAKRNLQVDDLFRLQTVSDPAVSPEGKWVAYTVSTKDLKKDKSEKRVWMAPLDGATTEGWAVTAKGTSASDPAFSPDGRYLAFLAARPDEDEDKDDAQTQVWLLDRRGGEAQKLTEVLQGVQAYDWSPDGKRLLLQIQDPTPEEIEAYQNKEKGTKPVRPKTPRPEVIDRVQMKRDNAGYLDHRRVHLFTFDMATHGLAQITSGDFDDTAPVWSPDGRFVAFVSNRTDASDSNYDSNVWVVGADNPDKGRTLVKVSDNPGSDEQPAWSPDGKWIAYVSNTEPALLWYATEQLMVAPAPAGGTAAPAAPRALTKALDRNVRTPRFTPDGTGIYFRLEDHGEEHLARIPVAGGAITRPIAGERSVGTFTVGKDGTVAALIGEPKLPEEVFVLKGTALKQATHVNQALLGELRLGDMEKVHFKSKDGTPIEGFVVKPPGFTPEMKYPVLLRIHGGPVSQYDASFDFEPQLFAANGYVVVLVNPRGSSGYGQEFCKAIFADWGTRDGQDVLAGVDYVIGQGYGDPSRLGVGGWSYGGILTNYVISQTDRFKGAISGAGGALWAGFYGHDHYQLEYEAELGLPWKSKDVWDKLSSPFYNVEKITTPTLYMGGSSDWNVPIIGSEHMYQALRRLGRKTQLVVYPGQHHGISKPTYQKDRLERYLAWYGKYVKGEEPAK